MIHAAYSLIITPKRQRITSNDYTIRNEYVIESGKSESCPSCIYFIIFDESYKRQMANILSGKCSLEHI